MKISFDNEKYLKLQSENILNRVNQFGDKLYIEFGGKLFDDYHASRVLPGFEKDTKLKMLLKIKDDVEVVIAISAKDIIKNKIRNDIGINYEGEVADYEKVKYYLDNCDYDIVIIDSNTFFYDKDGNYQQLSAYVEQQGFSKTSYSTAHYDVYYLK